MWFVVFVFFYFDFGLPNHANKKHVFCVSMLERKCDPKKPSKELQAACYGSWRVTYFQTWVKTQVFFVNRTNDQGPNLKDTIESPRSSE